MYEHDDNANSYIHLYGVAFERFGSQALWNLRRIEKPTIEQALTITTALRTYGGMDGRRLAEAIEQQCRIHKGP